MELPKKYNPSEEEPKIQKFWEDNQINNFDSNNTDKPIFSIDTPPPTVSGKMHMGHAFGNSQQDFIARYKRMQGFNVLQPLGTDDNGLPTQMLIQKLKKVKAQMMDRKSFAKLCHDTLNNELKPSYINDWKRLGISCDFNITYSTIDPHCQKISQKSFIDLYKAGREYRKEAPAMYCPKCQTAISQVECEDVELNSFFNDIIFKTDEEDLTIATTRPELLPACVAIFYHPDDKRYQHLKGKKAKVPLFDYEVTILEDKRADPEKGTGLVMCCTFGDSTDCEWQKAHNLEIKEAIDKTGKMTALAQKYEGQKIEEARKNIIADMKESKLLINQKPIKHAVNVHERCGTPIEFVHSKQWFIKYLDLKEDMLHWGNELNWLPKHMKNRYDNWVQGLQWDWCISRQIYFGIPFPVWYCEDCDEIILANESDLPVDPTEDKPPIEKCPTCGSSKFIPERDIINTWATSSLSPTIVKELFKGKPCYDTLINNPMSFRPQGHDIISFWLFNTVVKSQMHFEMLPWTNCFINGWMLDPKGKKMSKSKGNVIEPQSMIVKYSADALRYLAGGSKLGDDLSFQEKELVAGKKMVNKIWNATKFAIMNLEDYDVSTNIDNVKLELIDKGVLSRMNDTIKECTEHFDNYAFSKAKASAENFFWSTCDNYLEICKGRIYNSENNDNDDKKDYDKNKNNNENKKNNENTKGFEGKLAAQFTLHKLFSTTLKLLAPFMPHITEAVYQLYFAKEENTKSIHNSSWPKFDKLLENKQAEIARDIIVDIIGAVRKYKSEQQVSLNRPINLIVECNNTHKDIIEEMKYDLTSTCKAEKFDFGKGNIEVEGHEDLKVTIELLDDNKK